MSFELKIDAKADQMSLTISGFEAEDAELLEARITEVANLLNEILASDEAANDMTQEEQDRLHPALTALELKYKWLLHQATEQAKAAKSVAEGSETISQHGFPEFDDA